MANPFGTYIISTSGLTTSTTSDFFQLRNPTGIRAEILEISVFQTGSTALAMNAIRLLRGTGGTGGTSITTEYSLDTAGVAPGSNIDPYTNSGGAFSANVGASTTTLIYFVGWNTLQAAVWLPTPKFPLVLRPSDQLGLSLNVSATISGVGVNIVLELYGA
jgi:hypothetical protein